MAIKGKRIAIFLCAFSLLLTSCGGKDGKDNEKKDITPVAKYTITWVNYDGTELEKDIDVPEGTVPSYDGAIPTKPGDDHYTYAFDKWDPEVGPATKDQTYTATFTSIKNTYVIDFDLNGGESPSYHGPITVEELSVDDFFFDCTKTGWNFRGWSYDNQRIFDEKGHQLVNPVMAKNMVFKAMFAQTARLTIEKNIPEAGIVTGEGEYAYNTDVDISAKANDGYIFVGWYVQNILVSASEEYKYRMWSEDVVIEARFSMTVNKLHIESNNPTMGQVRINNNDGGSYGAEDNGYFSRGTSVTVVTYTLGETRFLGWFDEDNELVDTGAIYTFIMPDEEYSLEAKWNNFNITYKLEGGINDEDNPDHYTVESGVFALKPAHKDGYRFDGWKLGDDIITSVDSNWLRHIELTAVWGIDEYTITYHLNGGTNNPNNPTTFTAFDDTITLLSPSKTGYTFSGWYSDPGFEERVYDIPSGTSSDVELYAKWKVISYTITYLLNGGTNNSGNPSTYTIEDEITLLNPSKIGYVFSHWTNNSGETVTKIQPGTTGNLTLTANWNLAKYNVTTNVYPAGAGSASIVSGEGYYDETITVTAAAFDNNIFRGWMINNTIVSRDYTYSFKMPNSNVSLVARFYDSDQIEHIERGSLPHLVNSETITYGMYPKTRVTNSSLIAALESTSISGNYYVYNGNYYSLRIKGEEHLWFKCELIEWTVLEKYGTSQDGADLYKVISKDIIDARPYNDSYKAHSVDGITYYANDYEYSSIRSYLNDDFLTGGLYGGSYAYSIDRTYSRGTYYTLKDKVCILTEDEMKSFFPTAESRICSFTDYASSFNPETRYLTSSRGQYVDTTSDYKIYTYDNSTGEGSAVNCRVDYWYGIRPSMVIAVY